eukprot:1512411-Lingulodinium_polyedra.AAC.1
MEGLGPSRADGPAPGEVVYVLSRHTQFVVIEVPKFIGGAIDTLEYGRGDGQRDLHSSCMRVDPGA